MNKPGVAEFREAFPQFTEDNFPDGRAAFWLSAASKRLDPDRWGDLLAEGMCLFAAHNLTLERAASLAADGTGGMDAAGGPVTAESKTVGSVSLSKTRSGGAASVYANAGHYNDTSYGKQFYELLLIIGAGGLQV